MTVVEGAMVVSIFRQVVLGLGTGIVLYALVSLVKTIAVAFDSELSKIPGPFLARFTGLPLKFAVLGAKRSVYIHELHQRYGPFVRIAPQEIAVADIDGWRKIHKVGSDFNKGPWYQSQVPQQHSDETAGIFAVLNNKRASVRRRMFQSAGTKKIVQEWEPMVVELATMTISNIKEELKTGRADVMKWWTFMTSDVLGEVAFGKPFDNVKLGRKSQLVSDIETTMPYIGVRIELPWLSAVFDLLTRLFYPSMRPPFTNLINIGKQAVVDTKRAVREGNKTLFSRMVNEEDPKKMVPDHVIEQEAANLIVAGTDTTAMLLTYLTFEVLQNTAIHRRVVEECRTLHEKPSWDELEGLPYLNNVITEALRLHPSVPGSLKRIVPPGGEDFGKYIIPAGTQVDTQALTFHLDPKVYQDPLKFDPDRWNNASTAMKEHFMAFGCPSRICLGQNIARLEMLHALFLFFRSCPNVRLAPSATAESMEIVDFFSVKPKGGCLEIQPVQV